MPPKRFEDASDPRFDPIRGRSWFRHLLIRKWQLPALRSAKQHLYKLDGYPTQSKAAEAFRVDERELRDYVDYVDGVSDWAENLTQPEGDLSRRMKAALDHAYDQYNFDNAKLAFHAYVESSAKLFGLKPRAVRELWETDPKFYPKEAIK